MRYPFMGSWRVNDELEKKGFKVKRIQRLQRLMGLETFYPKPNARAQYKYPYLLKDLKIVKANQVWAVDIAYIPMKKDYAGGVPLSGGHN